ncbi:MAG: DUF5457 domain-containing protein [Crocinitomicaceae bacterium]|nr:DUF5457 domain-containing protein [Flavobacteriales bacterium]NQZ35582.1 DUF5457 domain-containing protein [Crocinitomicaceae bacterium]
MAEKTKPTQEEIPLHEVVLELMFEANKEKPAELSANEVFWKISDSSLIERNISEVLNWLVSKRRAEEYLEKYTLSRNEFLDRRNIDRGIIVSKEEVSEASTVNTTKDKKSTEEEIPLHEIVLKIMFEENKENRTELSVNDIFWKSSDPLLRESQVGDVLKWLLHHSRVEYRGGKYSLDRFELLEQIKVDKPEVVEKAKVSEPPVKTIPKKKSPKIVVPPAPKETIAPKPSPEKVVNIPKTEERKETVAIPKQKETKEIVVTAEKVSDTRKVNMILLIIAAGFFAYTCYLLISMSSLTTTLPSKQLQDEIVSVQLKLEQLSEKEASTDNKLEIIEERLSLIQAITFNTSEQLANQNQNILTYNRLKVASTSLFLSNSLILLIFAILFYRSDPFHFKRN